MKEYKIAMFFKPNRESQKYAKHFNKDYTDYTVVSVPFNLNKYGNINTIKKRLAEYSAIAVHKFDCDIQEFFNENNIKFIVYEPIIKLNSLQYKSFGIKRPIIPKYNYSISTIIDDILLSSGKKITKTAYQYSSNKEKIIEIEISVSTPYSHFITKTKKECVENRIVAFTKRVKDTEKALDGYKKEVEILKEIEKALDKDQ